MMGEVEIEWRHRDLALAQRMGVGIVLHRGVAARRADHLIFQVSRCCKETFLVGRAGIEPATT